MKIWSSGDGTVSIIENELTAIGSNSRKIEHERCRVAVVVNVQ